MIRAVIFDVYGTLISTGTGSVDAAAEILRNIGSDIPPKEFYGRWKKIHKQLTLATMEKGFITEEEIFRRGLRQLYREYGLIGDADRDVEPMLRSLTGRKVFPDVPAGLENLRERYRICIGSNTDTEPLMENLRENGIAADGIWTSESLRCYKPDPRFYERLLKEIDIRPEEAVFVGDSPAEDIEGPQKAGMKTILLDRKSAGQPEIIRPDRVLGELPAWGDLF